nr:ulp1 protease family, C-terminal catalytic domain-containing protein [Tanacetum cinerariifolium]
DNVKKLFEQYKGFFKETFLLEETKGHEESVKTKPAAVKAKDSAEMPKPVEMPKPKPAAVKTKEVAEKPKPAKNVKEVAEKSKEPAEKAQEAPQYVKPKPKEAAVKTNEAAEKPMPTENVKELAENPKEPVGDDYQVVHAATVMKPEDHEEFEVETFTQWIEGNIDWVGEDELHDWPRVVEPINTVQPSTPKRVFSSPSKGYVKPVKTVNTPYMCRRIDVTARCKGIEFVLGNSLFAMEGDKYETIFKSLGSYRELSSVRVNMETLALTLCVDANVIDCWCLRRIGKQR